MLVIIGFLTLLNYSSRGRLSRQMEVLSSGDEGTVTEELAQAQTIGCTNSLSGLSGLLRCTNR